MARLKEQSSNDRDGYVTPVATARSWNSIDSGGHNTTNETRSVVERTSGSEIA